MEMGRHVVEECCFATWRKVTPKNQSKQEQTAYTPHVRQPELRGSAGILHRPDNRTAAELVLARYGEIDGDHYELLTPAAEALEQRHPLAATLLLRAMVSFTLDRSRHARNGDATRHLQTCEYLAKRIADFGDHPDHDSYATDLMVRHERKIWFWGYVG